MICLLSDFLMLHVHFSLTSEVAVSRPEVAQAPAGPNELRLCIRNLFKFVAYPVSATTLNRPLDPSPLTRTPVITCSCRARLVGVVQHLQQ